MINHITFTILLYYILYSRIIEVSAVSLLVANKALLRIIYDTIENKAILFLDYFCTL